MYNTMCIACGSMKQRQVLVKNQTNVRPVMMLHIYNMGARILFGVNKVIVLVLVLVLVLVIVLVNII